ncbi:hypothetical protein SKAU_G00092380, partial [Synaphobranchus kaupii]
PRVNIQKCRQLLWARAHLRLTQSGNVCCGLTSLPFKLFLEIMDIQVKEEKDHPNCYQHKVQKPASVMVSGCVSAHGMGNLHIYEGTINAERLSGGAVQPTGSSSDTWTGPPALRVSAHGSVIGPPTSAPDPDGAYCISVRVQVETPQVPVFHPVEDFPLAQSRDDTLHFASDQTDTSDRGLGVILTAGETTTASPSPLAEATRTGGVMDGIPLIASSIMANHCQDAAVASTPSVLTPVGGLFSV